MKTKQVITQQGFDPMAQLHALGIRSSHAHLAALASIGLSLLSWAVSRGKKDDRAQSDRWGIFVGQWAPTLFAIGIALKQEEQD